MDLPSIYHNTRRDHLHKPKQTGEAGVWVGFAAKTLVACRVVRRSRRLVWHRPDSAEALRPAGFCPLKRLRSGACGPTRCKEAECPQDISHGRSPAASRVISLGDGPPVGQSLVQRGSSSEGILLGMQGRLSV